MSWVSGNNSLMTAATRSRVLAGELLPDGLLPDVILRSWRRCLDQGMKTRRLGSDIRCIVPADLEGIRGKSRLLLHHSQPVMEQLHEQIAGTSSVVLLTDATGVVLHAVGDQDFMDQTRKVALQPGGIWSEENHGTNAIGTALVEQVPVLVHSMEHFAEANHFLTCSAAPIFDPKGRILGVLDVSGDSAAYQRHTMALVRMSAQMIENQFFAGDSGDGIQVHFHLRPEFIGTLYEGIALFSCDGRFVAGNRAALLHLGLDRYDVTGRDFSSIFDLSLVKLFESARILPQPVLPLRLHNGVELFGRVKFSNSVSPITFLPIATSAPELALQPAATETGAVALRALDRGDPAMARAIGKVAKVLGHDIPIMIEGESGSGKELFARAVHDDGPRKNGPFVAINCAAIPEGLIESELFGYRDGAFTGARRTGSVGKIQQADGGTLFLDEIGDMPLSLQARLLRVLQDRTVTPLGGTKAAPVNIVLLCASNRRLRDEVAAGRFREDLYYRLNGLLITLPALRERADRIPLAMEIMRLLSGRGRMIRFSAPVLEMFEKHPWPGNIRQLTNVVKTALALSFGEVEITPEHLPEDFLEQLPGGAPAAPQLDGGTSSAPGNPLSLGEMEDLAINASLRENHGNISAAARKLGISRNTLYRRLKVVDGRIAGG